MDIPSDEHIAQKMAKVNEVATSNANQMVLVHWSDMDEERWMSNAGDRIKAKWPIEVECLAVGILTGEPAFIKQLNERHTHWVLPTTGMMSTVASIKNGLNWVEMQGDFPTNVGGSFLTLDEAEEMDYHPFGETETRYVRAAQVVVGEDNIRQWLEGHKWFAKKGTKWFAEARAQVSLDTTAWDDPCDPEGVAA